MKLEEFTEKVKSMGWRWAEVECDRGLQKGKKGLLVEATDRTAWVEKEGDFKPIANHITFDCIEKMTDFGQFTRQFPNVVLVTRIVGYNSIVHNWNPAKRRELTDRHKGNYKVFKEVGGASENKT